MPLKYACFISYRHATGFSARFVKELYEALHERLQVLVDTSHGPVIIDQERLKSGGTLYNPALSSALCQSACLVVIFTPVYFNKKHTYCAREYRAMVMLEKERLKLLEGKGDPTNGLVIPVVFRGWNRLPEEISKNRQCYRFDQFQPYHKKLGQGRLYSVEIEEMASYIALRFEELNNLTTDLSLKCSDFKLPTDREIRDWLDRVALRPMSFPLRSEGE